MIGRDDAGGSFQKQRLGIGNGVVRIKDNREASGCYATEALSVLIEGPEGELWKIVLSFPENKRLQCMVQTEAFAYRGGPLYCRLPTEG